MTRCPRYCGYLYCACRNPFAGWYGDCPFRYPRGAFAVLVRGPLAPLVSGVLGPSSIAMGGCWRTTRVVVVCQSSWGREQQDQTACDWTALTMMMTGQVRRGQTRGVVSHGHLDLALAVAGRGQAAPAEEEVAGHRGQRAVSVVSVDHAAGHCPWRTGQARREAPYAGARQAWGWMDQTAAWHQSLVRGQTRSCLSVCVHHRCACAWDRGAMAHSCEHGQPSLLVIVVGHVL